MGRGNPSSEEWRQLRAQAGGLARALKAAEEKRDEHKARADRLAHRLQKVRENTGGVHPEVAALREDLGHAVDCLDTGCDRCDRIQRRLDMRTATWADAEEVARRLREWRVMRAILVAMVDAAKARGPGTVHRRAELLTLARDYLAETPMAAEARLKELGLHEWTTPGGRDGL